MKNQFGAAVAAVALCLATPAAAQNAEIKPVERPDPASLSLPDMAFKSTPRDVRRYDTYYYFHKPGVSYERAFADFDQCHGYALSSQLGLLTPTIIPLGAAALQDDSSRRAAYSNAFAMYGLVGLGIAAIFISEAEDDNARATVRKCMTYKHYGRYGLSRALFKKIDEGADAQRLGRWALIAAGPASQAEVLP